MVMSRYIIRVAAMLAVVFGATTVDAHWPGRMGYSALRQQIAAPPGYQPVYRLAGLAAPDHLYTTDGDEARRVAASGTYRFEGAGFFVMDQQYSGSVPLYRMLTPTGRHILSTNPAAPGSQGARMEGAIGYVDPRPHSGTVALYAWFNPSNGDSLYTTDPGGEWAPRLGMQYVGVVCFVAPAA
jgi:hypothetical protein